MTEVAVSSSDLSLSLSCIRTGPHSKYLKVKVNVMSSSGFEQREDMGNLQSILVSQLNLGNPRHSQLEFLQGLNPDNADNEKSVSNESIYIYMT